MASNRLTVISLTGRHSPDLQSDGLRWAGPYDFSFVTSNFFASIF